MLGWLAYLRSLLIVWLLNFPLALLNVNSRHLINLGTVSIQIVQWLWVNCIHHLFHLFYYTSTIVVFHVFQCLQVNSSCCIVLHVIVVGSFVFLGCVPNHLSELSLSLLRFYFLELKKLICQFEKKVCWINN